MEQDNKTDKKTDELENYRKGAITLGVVILVISIIGVINAQKTQPNQPPPQPSVSLPPIPDEAWFASQHTKVKSLDQEIRVAKDSLKRHLNAVEQRSGVFSISRKEDRQEAERLNHNITRLEQQRLTLISRYNSIAAIHSNVLGGSPKEISAEPKKGLLDRVLGR